MESQPSGFITHMTEGSPQMRRMFSSTYIMQWLLFNENPENMVLYQHIGVATPLILGTVPA